MCIVIKMSIAFKRPLHAFDNDAIRPGPVGSVGDVLGSIRLKHSAPELPIRKQKLPKTDGSNVQDGQYKSFTSKGQNARVYDSNWQSGRAFKTSHGWVIDDLRAEDRLHEPFLGNAPQYSWKNKVATVYRARTTGDLFLPLPGGYNPSPGEIERGTIVPEIVAIEDSYNAVKSEVPMRMINEPRVLGKSQNSQSGFIRPVPGRR